MTATTEPGARIEALDIVRGVAVMGILAMNIVGFGMPSPAYMNPAAFGVEGSADLVSWAFSFLFIDGKMRGLFSLLFGASMLLVIQRAEARGNHAGSVHFRRMAWLLVLGLIHFYLIWHGDILTSYALVGMAAFLFRGMPPGRLLGWAVALLVLQFLMSALTTAGLFAVAAELAGPNPSAATIQQWQAITAGFGTTPGEVEAELATFRSGYGTILDHRLTDLGSWPLLMLILYGPETLGYFLLGMWAFKTGFLTGDWTDYAYARTAALCLSVSVPAYAVMAYLLIEDGFTPQMIHALFFTATIPFRPLMVLAIAAVVILASRRGGALVDRIAAAGRAAFTNYLGTSLIMTTFFYGYGAAAFGTFSRAELWLVVIPMWGLMLLWSKPWLDRYRYGPFEWLWRTLARWEIQPMRRPLPAT